MTLPPLAPETQPYFSSCLAKIRETHPDFPLDPVIFQSILLCLIAGGAGDCAGDAPHACKNLILRTGAEDVSLVLNLATMILTTIFGFPTHKYKAKQEPLALLRKPQDAIRTQEHPTDFLRRLFVREKHGLRHSSGDPRHRDRARRPGSGHHPHRSSTFTATSPTESSFTPSPLPTPIHTRESTADPQTDAISVASSRWVPVSPTSTLRMRPHAPHMQTDPTGMRSVDIQPIPIDQHRTGSFLSSAGSLPKALVVSGLENVETPAQRLLLRVLQYRKVSLDAEFLSMAHPSDSNVDGIRDLPPDFFMVYVCPLDPHERPAILETLLDRFAMSADVSVSPAVRQTYAAYRSSINTLLSASFTSLSPRMQMAALHPLDTPPVSPSPRLRPLPLGSSPQLAPTTSTNPVVSVEDLQQLRSLTRPVPSALPTAYSSESDAPEAYTFIHPSLNIYMADLFSATRHHPLLDGGLLTLRAHRDAEDLVRAYRVICGDSLGAELITTIAAAPPDAASESQGPSSDDELRTEDEHGLAWDRESAWLGAELRAGRRKASSLRSVEVRIQGPDGEHDHVHEQGHGHDHNHQQPRMTAFASRDDFVPRSFMSPLPLPPEVWDVSEVDIGRVFPRVVSHRLRVRSGPDDEILGSIMHPAVRDRPPSEAASADRQTVKQIVVGILADV